jgi:hypothetical protein
VIGDLARFAAGARGGLTVTMTGDGGEAATFVLDAAAARALADLLAAHHDPDDHGACAACGGALDRDLYCAACGRVDGIFGQALAAHAEAVRRRDATAP